MNQLSTNIGSLTLANPIVPASGTIGYGLELSEWMDLNELGAILTKSITLLPKKGNPQPRLFEIELGLMNSIGLENQGWPQFVSEIYPFISSLKTLKWVSIAGSAVSEYVELLSKLQDFQLDAVEINVSCPNVKKGGVPFCFHIPSLKELLKAVKKVNPVTKIIKISLESPPITDICHMIEDEGFSAVCIGNTVRGLVIDLEKQKPYFSNQIAGMSGPAIKPIALRAVWEVYQSGIKIPIIGCGGIRSVKDVLEFILAGATCVEVGSANLIDPTTMSTIIRDLMKYCEQNQLTLQKLIGLAHRKE
ncbi:dihydroorotate dehydrogenase [bacterium]|nr:dihydroorotate dehydrogenase [bacterium]